MKNYEILEHKADLKIRAFGKNKKELFLNMLLAMEDSMRPEVKRPEERIKRKVAINSLDFPALLVDFLSEVLYLIQVNKEVYNDIKFAKFANTKLEAKLIGQKVEKFEEDIKAVTYHGLDVRQKEDGNWEATVLFDV
jgi:SHS2 domain-containing protein